MWLTIHWYICVTWPAWAVSVAAIRSDVGEGERADRKRNCEQTGVELRGRAYEALVLVEREWRHCEQAGVKLRVGAFEALVLVERGWRYCEQARVEVRGSAYEAQLMVDREWRHCEQAGVGVRW